MTVVASAMDSSSMAIALRTLAPRDSSLVERLYRGKASSGENERVHSSGEGWSRLGKRGDDWLDCEGPERALRPSLFLPSKSRVTKSRPIQ